MEMISPVEITLAAFSVITAILIGWQIYTIINIDQRIRERVEGLIGKEIATSKEELKNHMDYRIHRTMAAVQFNLAQVLTSEGQYQSAFILYVAALCEWKSENNSKEFSACVENARQLVNTLKKDNSFVLSSEIALSLLQGLADLDTLQIGYFILDRYDRSNLKTMEENNTHVF